MPITWRGSACTPPLDSGPVNGDPIFAIVNGVRSRRTIRVLRFVAISDSLELSTTAGHIMPILRSRRCAAADVSGGAVLQSRVAWDTAVNDPDPAIKVLYSPQNGSDSNRITIGGSTPMVWQDYTQRQATAVEQKRTLDASLLSRLSATQDFNIAPGEAFVITWHFGAQPTGGWLLLNLAWEEDETDPGYTLGGTVTLDSVPVSGAIVHVLTDTTRDMTNPEIMRLTTNGSGEWSTQIATGIHAAAFVQHRTGETLYTGPGRPYLAGA